MRNNAKALEVAKRILVVTPWKRRWELGNSAGIADDHYFAEGLKARGYEVHFLCPHDSAFHQGERVYSVHRFPNVLEATEWLPSLLRRPLWILLFTWCIIHYGARVSKRLEPSVIIGHTQLSSFGVRVLARKFRIPSIVKLFGVVDLDRTDWPRLYYLRKNIEQILAFKVHHDAWIILDDGTSGDVAARRHGVPPSRVHLLPNGVNTEWAALPKTPTLVWERYRILPGTQVVLYLSRLTAWKRPDLFVRLAPRILEGADRDVVFIVAGDGPLRGYCEALAARLGMESAIRFIGPVPHDEVPHLMSATTVFASTNMRSNRGVPTCEAMVCGVPVVAFDVGDTRSVVREGETGRLIPEGDVEAFARAVTDLLNDDTVQTMMSRRAQLFAIRHFTPWPRRIELEARVISNALESMLHTRTKKGPVVLGNRADE